MIYYWAAVVTVIRMVFNIILKSWCSMKKIALYCSFLFLCSFPSLTFPSNGMDFYHTEKLANNGDADAQYDIGTKYEFGFGVERNYQKAREWHHKAAQQGHEGSQYRLGNLYYLGKGGNKDYLLAKNWYKKAASQGNSLAQRHLGFMYRNGIGVKKDIQESKRWYGMACWGGNEFSCNILKSL